MKNKTRSITPGTTVDNKALSAVQTITVKTKQYKNMLVFYLDSIWHFTDSGQQTRRKIGNRNWWTIRSRRQKLTTGLEAVSKPRIQKGVFGHGHYRQFSRTAKPLYLPTSPLPYY